MCPIDSSLDESMNEQVLTMTTSAFSASGITVIPAWCRWPTMISLSTRFLAQPREMRLTLIMFWQAVGRQSLLTPRRVKDTRPTIPALAPKAKRSRVCGTAFSKRRAGADLLLLGGGLVAGFLALQVGGAAF